MVLTEGSILVHLASASVLIQRLAIFLIQLFFEEGEVFHYGGAVTDIALTHAFHLSGILFTLIIFDGIIGFHRQIAAEVMKVSVASIHMNANFLAIAFQFLQFGVNLIVGCNFDVLGAKVFRNRGHSVHVSVDRKSVL